MSNCYNSELPIGPPGPTGPQGIQGLQGTDGTAWLHGVGEPAPLLGVYNDYYLDTDTGDLYVKEYQGLGLRWMLTTNIYGTPGTPGTNGDNGVNGTTLQWLPYDENFQKSLGISSWVTPDSTGINEVFYSNLFYILGTDLCPTDNTVARITIFYETIGTFTGSEFATAASVFYNLAITPTTGSTTLVNGGTLPSAKYNGTDININGEAVNVFTKVCYTIRRKSINTAEILTEWSSSSEVDGELYNALGNYYTPTFLTTGKINFADAVYNEFKFYPTIVDSTPTSNPETRAISFYIEKLI